MNFLKKYLQFLLALSLLLGCNSKKKPSLSGEDPVEVGDFIAFFETVKPPYQMADSSLKRKDNDSLLISQKVFSQFVPDSILTPFFGKQAKIKIYPLGKLPVKGEGSYLMTKAVAGEKRATYMLFFDEKEQYVGSLPLLKSGLQPGLSQAVVMDRRYTLTRTTYRKNKDASTSEGKDVYVWNSGGKNFMLIMTEALEDKPTELVNPIDTLTRKHKFSGDYTTGKMNLVSIRDGRRSDRITFFVHFEKNNGECSGELKGEAVIRSANMAEYREDGDPCVLRFNFTSSSVSVREEEGCGSHRGLRCSFNGSYPKKKEVKAKDAKSKKN